MHALATSEERGHEFEGEQGWIYRMVWGRKGNGEML